MILYFLMLAVGYYQVTLREGLKASNRYLKGRLHLFSLNRCETGAVGYCFLFSKRRLVRELEREGLTAVLLSLPSPRRCAFGGSFRDLSHLSFGGIHLADRNRWQCHAGG